MAGRTPPGKAPQVKTPWIRKFVVSEPSMLPALRPGDGLVAVRSMRLRRGQIRCFQHPDRPGFWLVKRVGGVRGTSFEACSDHDAAGAIDSRRFGYVPAEGSYRMVVRVPRRLIAGRLIRGDAGPDS